LALALPSWLIYFSIAWLSSARKKAVCTTLGIGAGIASAPYLFYLIPGTDKSRKLGDQFVQWYDPANLVNALGRCFADDIGRNFGPMPDSALAGTIGLFIFAILAGVIIRVEKLRKRLAPCLILCLWSMATLFIVGLVRPGIAPWYALIAACFWGALSAACVHALVHFGNCNKRYFALAPIMILVLVATWTWRFNGSYFDKQYYLENRSPVAASIMRNYAIAPESFAKYLFKLPGLSVTVTARMLERNRWSVFAPKQFWTMQGDSIFPLDKGYPKGVDLAGNYWIYGRDETARGDLRSFQHLNLCVIKSGVTQWRVSAPPNAKKVFLKTSVSLPESASSRQPRANWSISLVGMSKTAGAQFSGMATKDLQPILIDLSAFKGEDVSIQLAGTPGSAVIFEHPRIEVEER
jgi:hypothetical protein